MCRMNLNTINKVDLMEEVKCFAGYGGKWVFGCGVMHYTRLTFWFIASCSASWSIFAGW